MTTAATDAFDPFAGAEDTVIGIVRDPYPDLHEKRSRHPVEILREPDLGWETAMTYSHESVCRVLRDSESFSSSVYGEVMGLLMGRTILEMDEPEHRVHRQLVSHAFRQKVLAHWEESLVGRVVHGLLDRIAPTGRADLVRDLTFPFPAQVIAQ